jgi:hypothetical protein
MNDFGFEHPATPFRADAHALADAIRRQVTGRAPTGDDIADAAIASGWCSPSQAAGIRGDALGSEAWHLLGEACDAAPAPNFEENNYDAGFIAGLAAAQHLLRDAANPDPYFDEDMDAYNALRASELF